MISNLSMPNLHELVDLIPSPCVVFDLAPFSWPGEGGSLLWGKPPTSLVKGFALATLSWLSPIRRPRLWWTLIGAILRPYGAGTPKSEHLQQQALFVSESP